MGRHTCDISGLRFDKSEISKMKRYIPVLSAALLGLIVRTFPVWQEVFSPVGVKYNAPDSYYHARGILDAIQGGSANNVFEIYNHVAAYIIMITHIEPEILIAIMTLAVFLFTIPAVYLVAGILRGHVIAVIACFVFSVLPSEYLVRSVLGEPDHHAAEVFVFTWALALILLAFIIRRKLLMYGLLSLILLTGTGLFIYMLPLLKGYVAFLTSGYAYMTTEVRGIFASPPAATYIIEVIVAAGLLSFVLFKNRRQPALWVFSIWTVFTIILTIMQRRFDYLLTPSLAVLCAYGIIYVAKDMKLHWVAVMSFVLVVTTPIAWVQVQVANYRPPDEWVSNLKWLGAQTDSKVLAWWDYGYWINYYGMEPITDGGQGRRDLIEKSAVFYLTGEMDHDIEAQYFIIDSIMVSDFIPILEEWSGIDLPEIEDSFAYRLFNGENIEGYKYMIGDNVKIFEIIH